MWPVYCATQTVHRNPFSLLAGNGHLLRINSRHHILALAAVTLSSVWYQHCSQCSSASVDDRAWESGPGHLAENIS